MATQPPPSRTTSADEPSPRAAAPTAATSGSPGVGAASDASGAQAPSPNARIIKRYSNRKLYDTVESRYVTLPQIAELVRKGEDVRIIDNNSKEDLTSVTLAQILYEEERKQSRALPLTALKDLIHTSGERIMSSLRESPMGKLMGKGEGKPGVDGSAQEAVTAAPATGAGKASPSGQPGAPSVEPTVPASAGGVDDASGGRDGAGSASKAPGRLYEMFEQSRGSLQEWQHRVDERVRKVLENLSPAAQMEKLQSEVRRLTQRLEELETKLGVSGKKRDEETPGTGGNPGNKG